MLRLACGSGWVNANGTAASACASLAGVVWPACKHPADLFGCPSRYAAAQQHVHFIAMSRYFVIGKIRIVHCDAKSHMKPLPRTNAADNLGCK
jgi:hypothetical protein